MKVLLVGAAGFVGRHVLAQLAADGHSVVAVDRTPPSPAAPVSTPCCSAWHVADMSVVEWESVGFGVDAVVCTAASLNMGNRVADWRAVVDTNVVSFARLFLWAASSGVSRFVFTSSAGMYRRPASVLPVAETSDLLLRNPYHLTKALGEQLAAARDSPQRMACWALRLASPYGPGQQRGSVLPSFVEAAKSGRDVAYRGQGSRSQDFVHVEDAAWAHVACLQAPASGCGAINIGSGEETTMRNLAESVVQVFGRPGQRAVAGPPDGSDDDRFVLDVAVARSLLGFRPRLLAQGLADWRQSHG